MTLDEYLDLLRYVVESADLKDPGPEERRWHPEDVGVTLSLANDYVLATLDWVSRNRKSL